MLASSIGTIVEVSTVVSSLGLVLITSPVSKPMECLKAGSNVPGSPHRRCWTARFREDV